MIGIKSDLNSQLLDIQLNLEICSVCCHVMNS